MSLPDTIVRDAGAPLLQVDSGPLVAALGELDALRRQVPGAEQVIGLLLRGLDPAGLSHQRMAVSGATEGRPLCVSLTLAPSDSLWSCVLVLRALAAAQETKTTPDPLKQGFIEVRGALDALEQARLRAAHAAGA